jgi:hypothetical protein
MFGIGKRDSAGAGDPVSVAKVTGLFVIGAALIGAIPTSITLLSRQTDESTSATTTTSLVGAPNSGLRFGPLTNGKMTVSGSAPKDVAGMYVVIGPKSSGVYDLGCGNVVDEHWQADVATDASWTNYPLVTVPAYGPCGGAKGVTTLGYAIPMTEPSTTPAPPPGQVVDCTKQFGPSCLTGPGFGTPTTYQPNQ